jgi:hypothetical protein
MRQMLTHRRGADSQNFLQFFDGGLSMALQMLQNQTDRT